jgi:hypothetical protein
VRGAKPRFAWISNQLTASGHVVNTGQRNAGSNFSTGIDLSPESTERVPPPRPLFPETTTTAAGPLLSLIPNNFLIALAGDHRGMKRGALVAILSG